MNMIKRIAFATAAIFLAATAVSAADDHHDDKVVHKDEKTVNRTVVNKTVVRPTVTRGWAQRSDFRSGGHIAQNDWRNGRVIDYRTHRNLRAPPPGYEWREVNGQFVLAAVATGLIASIIMSQ
jgi:Ni/Co efflux regulator RcnB